MEKLSKYFSSFKNVATWTICYGVFLWAVLYFLFDFNIFSRPDWIHILRSQLHGFVGILFCILILVAIPIYIATITLIIRQNKPLIEIDFPKINLKKLFYNPTETTKTTETNTTPPKESETKTFTIPPELPREMRANFVRGIRNLELVQIQKQNTHTEPDSFTQNTENDILPLPADFDIPLDEMPGFEDETIKAPVFTTISFDDDKAPITPPISDISNEFENKMTEYLYNIGTDYKTIDDIIITDKYAIISHTDPDFWVIDDDNWFATGKSRPSPIAQIKSIASERGLTPVIYLGTENILDIETLIPQWESDGIIVITTPSDLKI